MSRAQQYHLRYLAQPQRPSENSVNAKFVERHYAEDKQCMLVSAVFFAGYAHPAKRPPISEPPPHNTRNRSPIARATARSGSRAALTWAVLWLGVDVKHPPTARAELGGAICRAGGMSRSLRLATIDSRFRVV